MPIQGIRKEYTYGLKLGYIWIAKATGESEYNPLEIRGCISNRKKFRDNQVYRKKRDIDGVIKIFGRSRL